MRSLRFGALTCVAATLLVAGCNDLVPPTAVPIGDLQPRLAVAPAGQAGSWSATFPWPIIAAHQTVLPDGRVLSWTSNDLDHTHNTPNVYLWNPAAPGTFSQVPNSFTDVFCAAHSFLPDGRLFIGGGHIEPLAGSKDANIFNYQSATWGRLLQMNAGRWYPTTAMTGSGDIAIIAGSDEHKVSNPFPEIWDGSKFRLLGGAPLDMPYYPFMHLAPDGRMFVSGPDKQSRYLNTSGDGQWVDAGQTVFGVHRDYGASVLYEPGKLLLVGGGDPPVNTAEIIDLTAGTGWKATGSMNYARRQFNATLLPNGKVLVTGGTSAPGFNTESGSVLPPEVWDPATGIWTVLATMPTPRTYHSTAVLLPDGRVLTAGGGRCGECQVDREDAELFSPPYLFNADGSVAARPTITSAPTVIDRGQSFTIATPNAASITRVTMVRLPSTTHGNHMNQGFASMTPGQTAGGVTVVAPANANLVPAGHYMLYILNGAGVPSTAKIVELRGLAAAPPPPPAPAAPGGLTASPSAGASSAMSLKWTDNSTSESAFRVERCQGASCTGFSEIAALGANTAAYTDAGLTAGTSYSYRVRATNLTGVSGYSNTVSVTATVSTVAPLVNRLSGRCMEVPGVSHANEVQLTIWDCHGGENQQWTTPKVGTSGLIKIYDTDTKCIDGFGAEDGGTNGDLIVTFDCHGGSNQLWTRTAAGGIRNFTGTMCIDVSGKSAANASKLILLTCDGSASQKWDSPATGTNQPPTASFTSHCHALECSFTNTSTDADGSVASWSWTFGDGGSATTANPTHHYTVSGTYVVTLTVKDDKGTAASTTKSLAVTAEPAPNHPPVANFTFACAGLGCSFTNTSTDSDGTIASSSWTFGDGATSTTGSPSHTYATGGTYPVKLTVTDDHGGVHSTTKSVTVTAPPSPNQPPVANFTFTCSGLACSFTNTSSDPDGAIASSSWAFGDGATSSSTNATRTYASSGTYAVTLTVTDDDGAPKSTTKNVTVSAPAGISLTASGVKVKGLQRVDLSWSGATTSTVQVYRDGTVIATAGNNTTTKSGSYTDNLNRKGGGSYRYKVCEAGSTTACSAESTVTF